MNTSSAGPVSRVLCVALLFSAACAGRGKAGLGSMPLGSDESRFFAAIVDTMVREVGRVGLRIDIRPLGDNPGILDPMSPSINSSGAEADNITARRAMLRQMHVTETNDASAGNCPIRAMGTGPVPGCPAERTLRVAIGTSRPGGAFLPGSSTDERASGTAKGERTVRVIVTRVGPGGAGTSSYDYVFAKDAGGMWKMNRRVTLSFAP